MKIAITVDPEIPVPPIYYGGIERIASMLIEQYIAAGHEVTLFAHESSATSATLFPYSGKSSDSKLDTLRNITSISREIYKGNYDILHSFSRLAYLTLVLPFKMPKIMSYQRRPTASQILKAQRLSHKHSLIFTGCSDFITNQIKPYGPATTIYNGFPEDVYYYSGKISTDAPLVFLGRLEPIKGTHNAIEIAIKSNKKLVIAGNIPAEYQSYFNNKIAPFIDNQQISYIGSVNDKEKADLLNSALALLMPIEWDEPFGIVMVEAMACGTPVIAFSRGAASEVIKQGVTGYHCADIAECVSKVSVIDKLDRKAIRDEAMLRYSSKVIAENYLRLYQQRIDENTKDEL
ncbi:glycosyltransferase family 4 protein [Flavihumibacter sp. R14]|nr:glycosyltransferase family 4 protein [Flavihumibacter soli]